MKQVFLVKVKRADAKDDYSVPMHEELEFIDSIDSNSWKAQNTQAGTVVVVRRLEKGDFYEYEVNNDFLEFNLK